MLSCCTTKSGACIIVDPGCKIPVQQQKLKRYHYRTITCSPEYIVLTHGHFDHVAGTAWAKTNFHVPC